MVYEIGNTGVTISSEQVEAYARQAAKSPRAGLNSLYTEILLDLLDQERAKVRKLEGRIARMQAWIRAALRKEA